MLNLSKKIIFTLVAIGLLWGFQSSATSDFLFEKPEILDVSSDQNNSEEENCELENLNFLNHDSLNFRIMKVSLHPKNQDQTALQKNFYEVPTSPPNC